MAPDQVRGDGEVWSTALWDHRPGLDPGHHLLSGASNNPA